MKAIVERKFYMARCRVAKWESPWEAEWTWDEESTFTLRVTDKTNEPWLGFSLRLSEQEVEAGIADMFAVAENDVRLKMDKFIANGRKFT